MSVHAELILHGEADIDLIVVHLYGPWRKEKLRRGPTIYQRIAESVAEIMSEIMGQTTTYEADKRADALGDGLCV